MKLRLSDLLRSYNGLISFSRQKTQCDKTESSLDKRVQVYVCVSMCLDMCVRERDGEKVERLPDLHPPPLFLIRV